MGREESRHCDLSGVTINASVGSHEET